MAVPSKPSHHTLIGLSSQQDSHKFRLRQFAESDVAGRNLDDLITSDETRIDAVAYTRTVLLLTETYCRVTYHGIAQVTFNDVGMISMHREFFNRTLLADHLRACRFPEVAAAAKTDL